MNFSARPSKHETFLDIAKTVSEQATCIRRNVGCVLVNSKNHILATGYNGVPAGAVPTPGSTQGSTLVSDLLKKQDSSSTFTDRDADAPGIAIVKTHLEGGALWYSTNNGTSWYDVGEVSGTNARLLFADSMTRLAYQPGPDTVSYTHLTLPTTPYV